MGGAAHLRLDGPWLLFWPPLLPGVPRVVGRHPAAAQVDQAVFLRQADVWLSAWGVTMPGTQAHKSWCVALLCEPFSTAGRGGEAWEGGGPLVMPAAFFLPYMCGQKIQGMPGWDSVYV